MSRYRKIVCLAAAALSAILLLPARDAFAQKTGSGPRLNTVQVDSDLEELAATLARAVNDRGVRSFLKKEIGKRFDNDTEALVKTLSAQRLDDGSTFLGTLAKAHAKAGKLADAKARASLDNLIARVPDLLQIAMPVHFKEWDPAGPAPLVAFAPVGVEDAKIETLTAFDAAGNAHTLSAKTPPASPVLVVGLNERGGGRKEAQGIAAATVSSEGVPLAVGSLAAHQFGDKEMLGTMRISNDHEPWHKGSPEIYIQGAFPGKPDVAFLLDLPGVDSENRTYTLNRFLFYWEQSFGTNFAASVWERDGSYLDSTPVDYNCQSLIVKRRQNLGGFDGDDALGCAVVHFSHAAGQGFSTGDSFFSLTYASAP